MSDCNGIRGPPYARGAWFYISLAIGVPGSAGLIIQAANWAALFTGYFGALSPLAVHVSWLAIGLVVFGIYAYRDQQRGADIDALLDTLPGVSGNEPARPRAT